MVSFPLIDQLFQWQKTTQKSSFANTALNCKHLFHLIILCLCVLHFQRVLSPVDTNDSKSECTTVGVTLAHSIEYTDNVQGPCWSSDEEELYERWLEEDYNLPDSNYTNWLKIRHPEVVPNEQVSVADHFPDVSPQSPIVFLDTSTPLAGVNAVSKFTTSSSISRSFESQLQSCQSSALRSLGESSSSCPQSSPIASNRTLSLQDAKESSPIQTSSRVSPLASKCEQSFLSKFLPSIPAPKLSQVNPGRILTSASHLAQLEEK